jgi:hypothetical protein
MVHQVGLEDFFRRFFFVRKAGLAPAAQQIRRICEVL